MHFNLSMKIMKLLVLLFCEQTASYHQLLSHIPSSVVTFSTPSTVDTPYTIISCYPHTTNISCYPPTPSSSSVTYIPPSSVFTYHQSLPIYPHPQFLPFTYNPLILLLSAISPLSCCSPCTSIISPYPSTPSSSVVNSCTQSPDVTPIPPSSVVTRLLWSSSLTLYTPIMSLYLYTPSSVLTLHLYHHYLVFTAPYISIVLLLPRYTPIPIGWNMDINLQVVLCTWKLKTCTAETSFHFKLIVTLNTYTKAFLHCSHRRKFIVERRVNRQKACCPLCRPHKYIFDTILCCCDTFVLCMMMTQ